MGASGKAQRDTSFTTKIRYFITSNWYAPVQAPLAVAKHLSLHDKSMHLAFEFSPSVFTTRTHFTTPQAVLPHNKIGGFFTSVPCMKMGRDVACNVYRVVPKDFLLLFINRFHPSPIQLAICCISKGLDGAMPRNANG